MLTLLHTESSMGWGGQEIRVYTELVHLQKRGYRVGLICQPGSGIGKRVRASGIRTWELPLRRPLDLLASLKVYRVLRQEEVRLINTHSSIDSWVASLAARMASVSIVRTRHLSVPLRRNPLSRLVYSHLCDRIITTGEAIRHLLIQELRLNPLKVIAIPTGVDLSRFNPRRVEGGKVRAERGLQDGVPLIGIVAVLRSWKGHRIFLQAVPLVLEAYPQAKFLIVGEGPQRKNIEGWIKEMELKDVVIMAGHREDIPKVLAALDVVVSASTAAEGVPQTLTQALAMERPVVATNVGGIPEVIRDGETGFLVPPKDPQALARGIIRVLEDRDMARDMGRKGRALVEREFTLELMVDRTLELYQGLITVNHKL